MRKAEKGFTWFYINDEKNFSKNMNIIHKKGYREKYDSYVVIKELDDKQINKLRIRRRLDYAVIYPGNFHCFQKLIDTVIITVFDFRTVE